MKKWKPTSRNYVCRFCFQPDEVPSWIGWAAPELPWSVLRRLDRRSGTFGMATLRDLADAACCGMVVFGMSVFFGMAVFTYCSNDKLFLKLFYRKLMYTKLQKNTYLYRTKKRNINNKSTWNFWISNYTFDDGMTNDDGITN